VSSTPHSRLECGELVRVPDDVLPEAMRLTANQSQHLLADAGKARRVLG
jgi:hypothetical protein